MQAWERNQYVATAMVFVVFTGFAFLIPFLPLYVRQLGVRDEESAALWGGILIGVTPLLAGLLAPVWGRLADRYGHKPMVVRALAAYILLLVLSALVRNVWELLALRVASGLFAGIGPLSLAMATALAPREHTGRAVGLVEGAKIVSAAAGPFAGGLLAGLVGIPRAFVATAGFCSLALLLTVFLYVETPGAAAEHGPRPSLADVLRIPKVASLLAVLFLVNFIGRSFTPILPLYLQDLGVRAARLGA